MFQRVAPVAEHWGVQAMVASPGCLSMLPSDFTVWSAGVLAVGYCVPELNKCVAMCGRLAMMGIRMVQAQPVPWMARALVGLHGEWRSRLDGKEEVWPRGCGCGWLGAVGARGTGRGS